MSENTKDTTTTVEKPKGSPHRYLRSREHLEPVELITIRGPQQGEDKNGNPIPILRGIDKASNIRSFRCTKEIYSRVDGKGRAGAKPDGYDFMQDTLFVAWIDRSLAGRKTDGPTRRDHVGAVVQLDVIPARRYQSLTPVSLAGVESVTARIHPDGSMVVESYPKDSKVAYIKQSLRKVANLGGSPEGISEGDILQGYDEVEEVTDVRIRFSLSKAGEGDKIYV